MKLWYFILLCYLCSITLITGCNTVQHDHQHEEVHGEHQLHSEQNSRSPKLDLQLTINPPQPRTNQSISFNTIIKEGTKPTSDAKVEIEVWKEGEKKHKMLKTNQKQPGHYQVTTTFQHPGKYFCILHVNTAEVHQMLDQSFQIY